MRVRSSKLPDFDGEIARTGMASFLAAAISPSYTAGHVHIASYAGRGAARTEVAERADAAVAQPLAKR